MLIECSLVSIKEFLEKETISCSIEKGVGEFPIDYLMIDMGEDVKGRPQLIELFTIQKEIPETEGEAGKTKGETTKDGKPNFLHIQYFLPFKFLGESVNDIARFLLLINKTLDFTGFGMSEVDQLVYFRLELFCERSKVNTELLKGLLGYVLLIVDSFKPTIEKLAQKQTTFQKVIEEMLGKK